MLALSTRTEPEKLRVLQFGDGVMAPALNEPPVTGLRIALALFALLLTACTATAARHSVRSGV